MADWCGLCEYLMTSLRADESQPDCIGNEYARGDEERKWFVNGGDGGVMHMIGEAMKLFLSMVASQGNLHRK